MKIDPSTLNHREAHHLMVGAVVPRPIAWISTADQRGVHNLAPFSAFCMVSSKPAIVCVGFATNRDGGKKDTLRNIEATGEFVVNIVDERHAEAMNLTSYPYPPGVSEFEKAKLTPAKADLVKAPLLAESPVSLECRLLKTMEFGEAPRVNVVAVGEVLLVHVKDECWVNGEIDMGRLKAVGRMGGDLYCRTSGIFEMKRPVENV